MSRDTENEKKLLVATTGTTSLKYKDMEQRSSKPDDYHGYHERSRDEVGLQVDSKVALVRSLLSLDCAHKSLKRGRLRVVARDGIEPPTPAFSGPPTEEPKWSGISGCS